MNFNRFKQTDKNMKSSLVFIVGLLWLLIQAVAFAKTPLERISIDMDKDTISANLLGADISVVAQALSKAGIRVFADMSIEQTFSADFENLPVEIGLKRIFGSVNTAFVFVKKPGDDKYPLYRVETVRIYNESDIESAGMTPFEPDTGSGESLEEKPVLETIEKPRRHVRQNPWDAGRSIAKARKNIKKLREKKKFDFLRIEDEIGRLNAAMGSGPLPADRAKIARKIIATKQKLSDAENSNLLMIEEEENDLRDLVRNRAKQKEYGKSPK